MTRRHIVTLSAAPVLLTAQTSAVTLPALPYAFDALEPHLDARTMELHWSKHHQTYVDNLAKVYAAAPELARQPLEQLIARLDSVPAALRPAVRNSGGGHLNHSLFWPSLGKPGKAPKGRLKGAIANAFTTHQAFEEKLRAAGLGVFGSGWVWVVPQGKGGLALETSPNQDSPWMSGRTPLFGLDVWEHAYYLKYQNRRAEYLAAVVKVLDWDFISARYEEIARA